MTDDTDDRAVPEQGRAHLDKLAAVLTARGIRATGPHSGGSVQGRDWIGLPGGRRVYVELDDNGCWQVLVYKGDELIRMADVDGSDWPGDPV